MSQIKESQNRTETIIIIRPDCLNADKAIMFLTSYSKLEIFVPQGITFWDISPNSISLFRIQKEC
jgi:hypothetical protein